MQMPPKPAPAPKSNHGFYLLGDKSLLLSHIPMFMVPHQAQLYLEVKLSAADRKAYLADKKKHKGDEYVLVTDPLVLPTLAPDAPKPLKKFTGTLYRGWPFNTNPPSGPIVVQKVTVEVVRSIFFHSYAGETKKIKGLNYYCFETPESQYIAHVLSAPPDFDQIMEAKVSGLKGDLKGAVTIDLAGANVVASKLGEKEKKEGTVGGKKVKLVTGAQLIYDAQHLATAM
jgi:hypothetical protein